MILGPDSSDETLEVTLGKVNRVVTENGGSVTDHEVWGLRKLAYPIKRQKEGKYVLAHLSMEPQAASKLNGSLNTAPEVMRHLLVKLD